MPVNGSGVRLSHDAAVGDGVGELVGDVVGCWVGILRGTPL